MPASQITQIVLTAEQEKAVLAANGNAVEWRSASGERLGIARFVEERPDMSAEEIAAAQERARRLGREYSPDEIEALRRCLQAPWSADDLRRLRQSRDPAAPMLSTAEVQAKLAACETQ
jgi:hypothetical protein